MNLLLINGSPKRKNSNTEILLQAFKRPLEKNETIKTHSLSLSHRPSEDKLLQAIQESHIIIIGFPLYNNSMPSSVLRLLSHMRLHKAHLKNKKIGFVVQYGFVEGIHGQAVERWLDYWVKESGCDYIGSIIKGGCDGLSKMKSIKRSNPIIKGIEAIAQHFAEHISFDPKLLADFAAPMTQKKRNKSIMKCIIKLLNHFYWKKLMKANGVSEAASFARPYES